MLALFNPKKMMEAPLFMGANVFAFIREKYNGKSIRLCAYRMARWLAFDGSVRSGGAVDGPWSR
jgi:hypothetical protein